MKGFSKSNQSGYSSPPEYMYGNMLLITHKLYDNKYTVTSGSTILIINIADHFNYWTLGGDQRDAIMVEGKRRIRLSKAGEASYSSYTGRVMVNYLIMMYILLDT